MKKQYVIYSYQSFYDLYQLIKPFIATKKMFLVALDKFEDPETRETFLKDIENRLSVSQTLFFNQPLFVAEDNMDQKKEERISITLEGETLIKYEDFLSFIRKNHPTWTLSDHFIASKIIEHQIEEEYKTNKDFRNYINKIKEFQKYILGINK